MVFALPLLIQTGHISLKVVIMCSDVTSNFLIDFQWWEQSILDAKISNWRQWTQGSFLSGVRIAGFSGLSYPPSAVPSRQAGPWQRWPGWPIHSTLRFCPTCPHQGCVCSPCLVVLLLTVSRPLWMLQGLCCICNPGTILVQRTTSLNACPGYYGSGWDFKKSGFMPKLCQ